MPFPTLKESKHFLPLIAIVLVAITCVFIRSNIFRFNYESDATEYVETAKVLNFDGGTTYPHRLLKPLAPLLIAGIANLMQIDYIDAFAVEVVIFYFALAFAAYFLFHAFFDDVKIAAIGSIFLISAYPATKYGLDLLTETGAMFFYVLALALAVKYFKHLQDKYLYLAAIAVAIGLMWKEYSFLAYVFLAISVIANRRLELKAKVAKIAKSGLLVALIMIAWQLVIYYKYHYSYLDWFLVGAGASPSESEYSPYYILKSMFAVFLLGWPLALLGASKWRAFAADQQAMVKSLILPSFMFLLWGYVSSRLYFVLAPLLIILALHALRQFATTRARMYLAVFAVVASNLAWLAASENIRHLFKN